MSTAEAKRESWLAERNDVISSTDAVKILGFGYSGQNAHTVFMEKTGHPQPVRDRKSLELGLRLEPFLARLAADETGYRVRRFRTPKLYRDKEFSWLGASPDGLVVGDPRGLGVAELKNVGAYLEREWRDQPPIRVQIQVQIQMRVCRAQWAIVFGFIGGNTPRPFEIARDDRFIWLLIPELAEFWRLVETRTPPPIDGSEGCRQMLSARYAKDDGSTIALAGEAGEEALRLFAAKLAIKERKRYLECFGDAVDNKIKSLLGEHSEALLPDGSRFSWKQQTAHHAAREAFDSSYRVLRQHVRKGIGQQPLDGSFCRSPIERMAKCTARLVALGATLVAESESGSRYFELAGGLRVRVADHEANEKTDSWMTRAEVAEVRVDLDGWEDQLHGLCGDGFFFNESEGTNGDE